MHLATLAQRSSLIFHIATRKLDLRNGSKRAINAFWTCGKVQMMARKLLSRKKACYILITCEEPSQEGKMEVEMTYEGDPSLVAYLIDSAQNYVAPQEP